MQSHWEISDDGEVFNPQVGIFWFIDKAVIKDSVYYKDGVLYDEAVQHESHYEFWQALKPADEGERKLKSRAYEAYPRGRTVFFPAREVFRFYHDSCLDSDVQTKVLDVFEIVGFNIEIGDDDHYHCAGCNPN